MTTNPSLAETLALRLGPRAPSSTLKGTTIFGAHSTGGTRRPPSATSLAPAGAELELRTTLGEGGMGIVHLATQRSLSRDVAVKRVRDTKDELAIEALVAEATLTGGLEHPAIVPVHALLRDDHGPLMVMKRLDGVTLRTLIHEPEHARWAELGPDRLGFFVQAVRRLCDALALAASHGVVHRDVKPENVMIGSFGEVYLLDWGVATRASTKLPAEDVAGTPAYMAPEMLRPDGGEIDARSDVYLLGATLHECVTGRPPHEGDTFFAVLASVAASAPIAYGSDVPPALAALLRKAMHADRAERFADARELGRALDAFVATRAALELVEAADAQRVALEQAIAKGAPESDVHAFFQACRFAYEHALRELPEGPAREGRERALLTMVDYALGRRDLGTARGLVAALGNRAPASTTERLLALERELEGVEAERARLRRLEADHDLAVGADERRKLVRVAAFGLVSLLLVLTTLFATGVFVPTPRSVTLISALGMTLLGAAVFRNRRTLLHNRMSRQIAYTVMLLVGIVIVHRLVGVVREVPIADLAAEDAFILAVGTSLSALTIRRLLFVPAVLFTAAAVAAPFLGPAGFVPVLGAGVLSVLFLLFAPASLSEPALGSVAPKNERGDPEA
ncbi:MAG: serine/threonine-protein kinase [Sandaracinus sp.]